MKVRIIAPTYIGGEYVGPETKDGKTTFPEKSLSDGIGTELIAAGKAEEVGKKADK